MPVDTLEGYEKYDNAMARHPASADLARKIFEYCKAQHGARLRWPVGNTGIIVSEPNYFAFGIIHQTQTSVQVDIYGGARHRFICPNGVTEDEAIAVSLEDRLRNDGTRLATGFYITHENQLPIAYRIVNLSFQLSQPRFQRQARNLNG